MNFPGTYLPNKLHSSTISHIHQSTHGFLKQNSLFSCSFSAYFSLPDIRNVIVSHFAHSKWQAILLPYNSFTSIFPSSNNFNILKTCKSNFKIFPFLHSTWWMFQVEKNRPSSIEKILCCKKGKKPNKCKQDKKNANLQHYVHILSECVSVHTEVPADGNIFVIIGNGIHTRKDEEKIQSWVT